MDLYELLGVRRSASAAEVRRGWQRKSRALHPALNPGDPVAAERYKEAAHAWEVLSDPKRRAAYDRGEREPSPVAPAPEGGFEGFDFSAGRRVEKVSFREIFDAALRPPEASPDALRGEDLEQATRVSFEESMSGTVRRLHLVRSERCPACRGSGDVACDPVPCPHCRGQGQVRGSRGHMIFSRPCRECGGRGALSRRPCSRCEGEGRAIASEWIEIQIPPGVSDGSQVRLPGAGNVGRRGGPPGDFVLTVEVEPHSVYRREGDDLHCAVPIGMIDAAVGGHVEVATPTGPVTIEVPAGTQNGQRFRLLKRGAPRLGEDERGDLWVEVHVTIPAVTGSQGRELLRALAKTLPSAAPDEEEGEEELGGSSRS
jgi:molecular chaperone DnaJ